MKPKLLVLLLCLTAMPVLAKPEFRIIELRHRFAEELLPALQPLVGDNGSIRAFGTQLIVNADASDLANIEAAIRSLDTQLRNWSITVDHGTHTSQQERNIDLSGRAGNRNVKVIVPDAQGRVSRGVSIRAMENSQSWQQGVDMKLTVMDGAQAYISSGALVPYNNFWITLARRHTHIVQTTGWQEVSTGFVVRPRQIGERVDIEIVPRLAQAGGSGSIDFTTLSTHVQVRPGEWLDLGGLMGNKDEVSRAILGIGDSQSSSTGRFRIKVE